MSLCVYEYLYQVTGVSCSCCRLRTYFLDTNMFGTERWHKFFDRPSCTARPSTERQDHSFALPTRVRVTLASLLAACGSLAGGTR